MRGNKRFIVAILLIVCLLATVLSACQTEHKCNHVCNVCGKCMDDSCNDAACADKCQGHKLTAPEISLAGKTVSWTAVENASGYEVYVNDALKATINETSYTLDETLVGDYLVRVLAKAGSTQYLDSEKSNEVTYTINPTKLTAPEISLAGKTVSWTAVENASGYEVYVNDALKATINETSYTLDETLVGDYTVRVLAKAGSTQYLDSEKSNEVTYTINPTKLIAPEISLAGKTVSWTAVENAGGYEVYVNDALKATINETSYTLDETLVGDYTVRVLAKAGSTQYLDSEKSNEVTYTINPTKLAAPEISLAGKTVSWTAVENASGYEVYVNDALKATINETSYTLDETLVGDYTVRVLAKAGSTQYIDSEKSNEVTVVFSNEDIPYVAQSLMADLIPTELMYDGSENQNGVTIRANVDGYITAIRVYCEANESGKRKAYIWDHETKTAVASFETEITTTSEGWYQFDLPTAVAITANKLYVVSINCGTTGFCPRGTALTSDIVKENIQTVGGGVYATAPDTYPEDSWNWSNYLRDVCFVPASEIYDINEENAKAITKHIDELLAMGTVNAENKERMQIRYDLIESVLATLDDEVKNRIDADKLTALEAKGQELDAYIYQSLMADLKPTELMHDGSESQQGVTIRANVDGYITAIRVYCEANESGKRKAYIWDVETKTAVASFETEITTTSEGWYQFDLPTPVAITANKLYVVSINCGSTGFCPRGTALTSDIVKENIQTVGGGVYATAPDTYPENSWNWSNYLRDVCFATKTEYDALHAA